jgi:hypothetical protein
LHHLSVAALLQRLVRPGRVQIKTKSSLPCENHESYIIITLLSRQVLLHGVHHLASDRLGPIRSSFTDARVESVYAKGPVARAVCIDQSVAVQRQHISWL